MMRRFPVVTILLAASALATTPAMAQSNVEGRVGRLESEMRAVQRKVFPGGNAYVEPDNVAAQPQTVIPGTPSASPVADLTARVDSLESQLRQMTGAVETNQHRIDVMEGRLKTIEADAAAARAAAPQPSVTPGGFGNTAADQPPMERPADRPAPARGGGTLEGPTMGDPTRGAPATTNAASTVSVERPETGDPAEDTYLYGYRLWTAKQYPQAETQLKAVVSKYPKHKRASYAQNLLGRSYLDENKPSLASLAFYDSYKNWPDGDRAPESLFYLAQALVKLDKPAAQVCKVYTELQRTYGAKVDADARMKAGVAKGRAASSCS
ncbi:TolA-binding protein [Sphingomonas sp. PvP055]